MVLFLLLTYRQEYTKDQKPVLLCENTRDSINDMNAAILETAIIDHFPLILNIKNYYETNREQIISENKNKLNLDLLYTLSSTHKIEQKYMQLEM